jgi:16S rRNA (adenine1518-N6/adenine1519-N6)-dimethyltransferase
MIERLSMIHDAPDGLPPLRQVIEDMELKAKKSLGQNFLLDLNLTRRIARTAGDLSQTTVIEIGAGPGGLTRALLMEGAAHVIVIEKDPRCRPALEAISDAYKGRLTILEGDALKINPVKYIKTKESCVVANLPYYVGTEILVRFLSTETWPPYWKSLTLMFQKEVAERITAQVNDDGYGRLGVLAQWRTQAEIAFDLHPQNFTPPPKVWSSVVHLVPRSDPLPCSLKDLERVTQAAFSQRRKMLRVNLKSLFGAKTPAVLETCGIDPTQRAETLTVEQFVQLANIPL